MSPTFLPDSFVFAVRYPWQKLKVDDVILVNHHHYGKMIKRIASIENMDNTRKNETIKITLKGDNPQSVTTEQMGEINESQVMGKVIWQVKPPKST